MKREQSYRSTRVCCLNHDAPGKSMPQGAAMIVGVRCVLNHRSREKRQATFLPFIAMNIA
eukprot:169328-Pelagomonas_calceolata.AAC.1